MVAPNFPVSFEREISILVAIEKDNPKLMQLVEQNFLIFFYLD